MLKTWKVQINAEHMMYNAGVKLTFGAKSNSPASVYKSQVDDALITKIK
jgi:hypothetical protein